MQFLGTSCTDFGGYHIATALDATHGNRSIPYVVVPSCPGWANLTGVATRTAPGSHEIIEAATDPFAFTTPAYYWADDPHVFWGFAVGGTEVGDLCVEIPYPYFTPAPLGFTVQRTWSNKAALASHDPCVPAPSGHPYFNSLPVLPDKTMISFSGVPAVTSITTDVVKIPVGQQRTIELDLFSDAATSGPWYVSAFDGSSQGQPQQLAFTFDRTSGVNGDRLHMTIKVLTAGPQNHELFYLFSYQGSLNNPTAGSYSLGAVEN
jgi:hypothetical protein